MAQVWRNCSVCKKPILQGATYQKCSVSSCRKSAYCSVDCWDSHVPVMNHKSAWAEEEKAPFEVYGEERPRRRIVPTPKSSSAAAPLNSNLPMDVLTVVSKLKTYIKARGDMNTSGDVPDVLSEIIRSYCDDAIEQARLEGRKTVMGRDFRSK